MRVIDDGIGISAEMLPQVFDLFMQERQAVDRAAGGLGLGLAIVKSLVRAHGGEVFRQQRRARARAASSASCLPLQARAGGARRRRADAVAASADGRRRACSSSTTTPTPPQTLAQALELHGFDTASRRTGRARSTSRESFQPEIAILDIGLPVMDGNELARQLKRATAICIVALTGYGAQAFEIGGQLLRGTIAQAGRSADIAGCNCTGRRLLERRC